MVHFEKHKDVRLILYWDH